MSKNKWNENLQICIEQTPRVYYGNNFGICTKCEEENFYKHTHFVKYKNQTLGQPRKLCLPRPCQGVYRYYDANNYKCKRCENSENVAEYEKDPNYQEEYVISFNSNKCKIKKCIPGYYPNEGGTKCEKCSNSENVVDWKNPGINCKIKKCNYSNERNRTINNVCPPYFRKLNSNNTCYLLKGVQHINIKRQTTENLPKNYVENIEKLGKCENRENLSNLDSRTKITTVNLNLKGSYDFLIEYKNKYGFEINPSQIKKGQTVTIYLKPGSVLPNGWNKVEGCYDNDPFRVRKWNKKERCPTGEDIPYKNFTIEKIDNNRITINEPLPFDLVENSVVQIEDYFAKIKETKIGRMGEKDILVKDKFKLLKGDIIVINKVDYVIEKIARFSNIITLDKPLEGNLSGNTFDVKPQTKKISISELFEKNGQIYCKLEGSDTNFLNCNTFFKCPYNKVEDQFGKCIDYDKIYYVKKGDEVKLSFQHETCQNSERNLDFKYSNLGVDFDGRCKPHQKNQLVIKGIENETDCKNFYDECRVRGETEDACLNPKWENGKCVTYQTNYLCPDWKNEIDEINQEIEKYKTSNPNLNCKDFFDISNEDIKTLNTKITERCVNGHEYDKTSCLITKCESDKETYFKTCETDSWKNTHLTYIPSKCYYNVNEPEKNCVNYTWNEKESICETTHDEDGCLSEIYTKNDGSIDYTKIY